MDSSPFGAAGDLFSSIRSVRGGSLVRPPFVRSFGGSFARSFGRSFVCSLVACGAVSFVFGRRFGVGSFGVAVYFVMKRDVIFIVYD